MNVILRSKRRLFDEVVAPSDFVLDAVYKVLYYTCIKCKNVRPTVEIA